LVRDTSVLHQVQLGVNKLTRTHREHIENTAKEEVAKMKQFGASDKEHTGGNMHKAITSKEWRDDLKEMNEQKSASIRHKCSESQIEQKHINSTLANINKEKQEAKTPQEIMKILSKEQAFLSSLDKRASKAPEYNANLLKDIENAHLNCQQNTFDQLSTITNYVHHAKILSEDKILEHLRSTRDIETIHEQIKQSCFKQHCETITEHYRHIEAGRTIEHDGHKFDCNIKYLEHWKSNVDHRLLPMNNINEALEHHHQQSHDEIDHRHHGIEM